MDKFINWFKDLAQRIMAKSPRFFAVIQYVTFTLVAFSSMALWLNSQYAFGFEQITIYGEMNFANLLSDFIKIFSAAFLVASMTISDKSKKKASLKLK